MTAKLRLDFDNLPLVEAAVRVSFNGPTALTYSLVNSIAAELKPSFPTLAESEQLEIAPGAVGTQVAIGPNYLPGAVYTGHTSGLSVHVQSQVIVARWVRHPGLKQPEYPRYGALRDALWSAVDSFRKACSDEFPGMAVVNMSYVNFVPVSDSAIFLKTYFSAEAQLRAMDRAREVRKLEAAWSEGDDFDVRFAIEQAAAKFPDRVAQGYRLTTAAGLRLGESLDAKSGLETVHDVLQEFFLVLISAQAKKEWQLREPRNA
jgi:uncharacterized protein (TIGR04255 family)